MSKDVQKILERLAGIEAEIRQLHERIENLESAKSTSTVLPLKRSELLKLPNTLRRTMMAIIELKEASSESVAKQTNRTRGMESIYLNHLVRMGYLEKIKRGKRIYFRTL